MNPVEINLLDFIALAPLEPDEGRMAWPIRGVTYFVQFQVEHVGPWADEPRYTLTESHDDLEFIFKEHGWAELIHQNEVPIASGLYRAALTYWQHGRDEDTEYGFNLAHLKRLRDLTIEEIQ